jgi:SAM-dependent methyltransferase
MKEILRDTIICPQCGHGLEQKDSTLVCESCGQAVPLQGQIPIFTQPPGNIQPSEKIERGAHKGTPWRQANWQFLQQQVARLAPEARILDVGAGRGDFAAILQNHTSLALDVYPYPEVDLVCDLTRVLPLRAESFDALVLMNVLEHVYNTHALLAALTTLLKPGGVLIMAVPFMVKIHQAPVDFVRYTHYALQRLGEEYGLSVETLEGYYDPISFLGEGIGNLKYSILPTVRGGKHYLARSLLAGIQGLSAVLDSLLGQGQTSTPAGMRSMAPTGYHILYRKNQGASHTA